MWLLIFLIVRCSIQFFSFYCFCFSCAIGVYVSCIRFQLVLVEFVGFRDCLWRSLYVVRSLLFERRSGVVCLWGAWLASVRIRPSRVQSCGVLVLCCIIGILIPFWFTLIAHLFQSCSWCIRLWCVWLFPCVLCTFGTIHVLILIVGVLSSALLLIHHIPFAFWRYI